MLRLVSSLFLFLFSSVVLPASGSLESLFFETDFFAPVEDGFFTKNKTLEFALDPKKGTAVVQAPGKFLGFPVSYAAADCRENRIFGCGIMIFADQKEAAGFDRSKLEEAVREKLKQKSGGKLNEFVFPRNDTERGRIVWHAGTGDYVLNWRPFETLLPDGKKSSGTLVSLCARGALESLVLRPDFSQFPVNLLVDSATSEFVWTSSAKDSARNNFPGFFFGMVIPEAVLRVKSDKIESMSISLFNRGDAGSGNEPTMKEFDAMVASARAALTERLGPKGTYRAGNDSANSANVARNESMLWKTPEANYLLEWNWTSASRSKDKVRRAEFLRLTVTPTAFVSAKAEDPGKNWKAAEHLKTEPSGDKYIFDVPMVDQGQKGYCAAAVAERVLRYYGMSVDQHEVAKLADTTADGGTKIPEMYAATRRIAVKLSLRMRVLWDASERIMGKILSEYNKTAKKMKKPEASVNSAGFFTADGKVFKEMRVKDKSGMARFERNIATYIDQGIPLLWGVQIGLVPEPKILPQMRGGHLRLIIGYNAKNKEVIYSDTWGAGHEMKKVKLDDAWAMTFGLAVIEP